MLSPKDIIDNNLDISLTHKRMSWKGKHHPLSLRALLRYPALDVSRPSLHNLYLKGVERHPPVFRAPQRPGSTEMLKRVKGNAIDKDNRKSKHLTEQQCSRSRRTSTKPRHFKLTIGSQSLRFNHHVHVDTMFLDGRPSVLIVDEATHFPTARFCSRQITAATWRAIQLTESWKLMRTPEHVSVVQGPAYIFNEMPQNMADSDITSTKREF